MLLLFVGFIILTPAGARVYQETGSDETSVVNAHLNELPVKFSLCVNEGLKTDFLRQLHKDRIKLDLLQILVLVLPLIFLNY